MSFDILGTSWDQYGSVVQYSFTSTETRRLIRTDSPGWPPQLSHSSWTIARFSCSQKAVCTAPLSVSKQSSGTVWKSWWLSWAPVLMSLMVSVNVMQHWTMHQHWSQFVPNMSTWHLRMLSNTTSSCQQIKYANIHLRQEVQTTGSSPL